MINYLWVNASEDIVLFLKPLVDPELSTILQSLIWLQLGDGSQLKARPRQNMQQFIYLVFVGRLQGVAIVE